jgi:hypothetical protein
MGPRGWARSPKVKDKALADCFVGRPASLQRSRDAVEITRDAVVRIRSDVHSFAAAPGSTRMALNAALSTHTSARGGLVGWPATSLLAQHEHVGIRHRVRATRLCLGSEGGSERAPTASDRGCCVKSRAAGEPRPL